jgi:hypothetical protein
MSVKLSSDLLIRLLNERKQTIQSYELPAEGNEYQESYLYGSITELDMTIRLIKDLAGDF